MDGEEVKDALRTLAQNQAKLTDLLSQFIERSTPAATPAPAPVVEKFKNPVARPEPFKTGAADCRRFIHAFTAWALEEGRPLNVDRVRADKVWINSALSYMQGEAATWASQYLQAIQLHTENSANKWPFDGGDWTKFLEALRLRFQATNDADAAQRELTTITQGKKTVAEYAARFQQVASRTGYSDADLMSRFKANLCDNSKVWLSVATFRNKPKDLDTLIAIATECDADMRNVKSDTRSAPTAAVDPNAMEIDATRTQATRRPSAPGPNGRTREEFTRLMRGRCYGCGDTRHIKSAGNHGGEKCNYCARMGHRETVCQDRFLGHPKGRGNAQRVAATSEAPFSLFTDNTVPAAAPPAASGPVDINVLAQAVQSQTSAISTIAAALSPDFQ